MSLARDLTARYEAAHDPEDEDGTTLMGADYLMLTLGPASSWRSLLDAASGHAVGPYAARPDGSAE